MISCQTQDVNMFLKISFFFFFFFAIFGIYLVFLPKILLFFGYNSFEIGVIFSVIPLVRIVLPFVFKFVKLNKNILYANGLLMLVSTLLFYISIDNFYMFVVVNFLFGIGFGVVLPFVESTAMEIFKKEIYGKLRLFGSLGFIVSTLTLTIFLQDPIKILHVLNICLFLAFIALMFILKQAKVKSFTKEQSSINLMDKWYFWLSLFLIQVSFGAFYNFFTIYETSHGISLKTISLLWSFGVVCEILFFYFQSLVLKRFSSQSLLKFSFFMTAIRWLLLYLFPSSLFFVFLSQSLHAISFALLHSVAFSYIHVVYKNSKLASQFYYGIAYGLGGFVGSIVSGFLYGNYVYLICAFIAFVAFGMYAYFSKEEKEKQKIASLLS